MAAKPARNSRRCSNIILIAKTTATAQRDYALYSYFVRRGYVCARVDIRGFGASEGVPTDREYSEQEQLDGLQIISWLAHQPWSNGNVGMMGISWSGFNSLQMAMRHAPELKAIIAVAATAELFHDDVHYMDGMAHVDEFELNMDMAPGMTGAPDYTLDEKVLGPRFDAPPWSLLYLKHQHDGPFWRSPVRPYSEIKIPCFIIGGLLDGYRDSITDMLQQTKAPLKAIVGPWNHTFPHDAVPGPQIEWRDEAVRWWDYWLKGRDTGVLQDPKLVIYMQHWHPPDPNLENVPGEWRREDSWPPRDVRETVFFPQPNHTLANTAPDGGRSSTQIRSFDRRGSRILVGRVAERSASRGRVQPGLRFRAAQGRSGDPGKAAGSAASLGHGALGGLVRAALGCGSRRNRHPNHGRGHQRRATRIHDGAARS